MLFSDKKMLRVGIAKGIIVKYYTTVRFRSWIYMFLFIHLMNFKTI